MQVEALVPSWVKSQKSAHSHASRRQPEITCGLALFSVHYLCSCRLAVKDPHTVCRSDKGKYIYYKPSPAENKISASKSKL